ncbi:MAG: bifunctional 5,10-methylenetetrahydrofolate dehydrogenase/5,10-methenyltetrahydrofolate cyclohydrolase [Verrucomicrobiia bacterium]
MPAQLIDGKAIADQVHRETRSRVQTLAARGIQPSIVFIRVGEDPASRAYVGMKDKQAAALGLASRTEVLPVTTSQADLLARIDSLNADPTVHGILVQAPLPAHISETAVFSRVDPRKDVDGFHPLNVGKLLLGDPSGFRPCTPAGIHELLRRSSIPTAGALVAILGRGNIVGKPLAAILCQKSPTANATVCLLHSASRDFPSLTRQADIVVAAMGRAELLRAEHIQPGATVIDVGVNRVDDPTSPKGYRLVGDIAFAEIAETAAYVTPNPGGVGPMTIAMLMANTVTAAEALTS